MCIFTHLYHMKCMNVYEYLEYIHKICEYDYVSIYYI